MVHCNCSSAEIVSWLKGIPHSLLSHIRDLDYRDWKIALPAAAIAHVAAYYSLKYLWELPKVGDLQNKAVIITGCDSGFGLQLAVQLAKENIPVFAACLTVEGIDRIMKLAEENPSYRLIPIELDVTNDMSVQHALEAVKQALKPNEYLWALVNNAGVFTIYGPDDFVQPEHYLKSFEVNCLGAIRMAHAFKPLLKKSHGRIISTSSVLGIVSYPGTGPYSVAKYGVEAYMDALRQEMFEFNVRCVLVQPAGFKTPLVDNGAQIRRTNSAWEKCSDETKREYGEKYKDEWIELWNRAMDETCSTKTYHVTDNYYHAITAQHPRDRYKCGWAAILIYTPLSMVPTSIHDWFIYRNTMKLVKKGTLQVAALQK